MSTASKKFVLIDGHALVFRGYYAIPPLHTKQGEQVNAVFGFTTILLNMLQKVAPDYCAVAFDLHGPTFRHEAYVDYKATRSETPDDLISQVPRIREIVSAFRIPILEQTGYEADDLIASMVHRFKNCDDLDILIVSSDMDLTQLIEDNVKLLAPLTGFDSIKIYNKAAVVEKFGITPSQIIDYKALAGDVSDNISGVSGIGKKTAAKLLQTYETLDGIYDHLNELSPVLQTKLSEGKEAAYRCQKLVRLVHDLNPLVTLEDCAMRKISPHSVRGLFEALNFNRLMSKFESMNTERVSEEQASLF